MEKKSTLLLALLFIAVLSALLCALAFYGKDRWYGNPLHFPDRDHRTVTGKPVEWRTIYKDPQLEWFGKDRLEAMKQMPFTRIGDFDGDGSEEIFLTIFDRDQPDTITCCLIEADGEKSDLYESHHPLIAFSRTFDHDGDQKDSLIADLSDYYDYVLRKEGLNDMYSEEGEEWLESHVAVLPVLDLHGREISSVNLTRSPKFAEIGDFNGDECNDVLFDLTPSALAAASAGTSKLLEFPEPETPYMIPPAGSILIADVNSDGSDEILDHYQDCWVFANDLHPRKFDIPLKNKFLTYGRDFRWEAAAELLGHDGYFEFDTDSVIFFQIPQGVAFNIPRAAIDLQGYEGSLIACDNATNGDLMLYREDGSLIVHETFPDWMMRILRLRAIGQDHIVLQFSDRILIYP